MRGVLCVGEIWEGTLPSMIRQCLLIQKAGDVGDWGITLNLCVLVFSNGFF